MPELVGETLLSRYHVDAFIAPIPLGRYYRVTDTRHDRPVGIIVLPSSMANNPDAIKRIEADSNRLRAISNPNLVPYLGLHQTAREAFLVEEWIDGPSLRDVLGHAPLSVRETLVFLKAVGAGLQHLHDQGYLHLALAPEMIHINRHGEIFLSGVGGACPVGIQGFLRPGDYPPHYAAPEQFKREPLTPAADIYALAILLYELSTGVWISGRPGPKTVETNRRYHIQTAPVAPIQLNPELPDHFSRMLLWALRKRPGDRLKTGTELLTSLALAGGVSVAEVLPRADDQSAPVTSGILNRWDYLPPVRPGPLEAERARLSERIARVLVSRPAAHRPRTRILPLLGLMAFASLLALIWLIRPAPPPAIPTPVYLTPFVAAQFTPPPTITPTPRPTHAPGNRIAFTCTRGEFNQICMINVDGTGLTQLSDLEASNYYPVFAPGGGALLFSSNRNGSFDLYLLSFDDRDLFQVTRNIGNVVSPDFSPDGTRIVFVNQSDQFSSSVWIVNSDGLNPHLVYQGINTIVSAAWSPDGEQIAYAMSRGVPNEYEIFLMDRDGQNNHQISQGMLGIGGSIDWSPDGRYVLIYAGPYEDKDIFRIDLETGEVTQLTDGGNNAAAVYSPDGRYIAFNSLRNDNQADIYVMNADGSLQRRLTNHPEPDWGPVWEP